MIALVWVVDACLAPVGLLAAVAAEQGLGAVMLVLPLGALLLVLARDRSARIEQAHQRLELVRQERSRLQSAVQRLGDAFASKLDLDALLDIVLRGSIEALDADAGRLELIGSDVAHAARVPVHRELADRPAARRPERRPRRTPLEQVEHDGELGAGPAVCRRRAVVRGAARRPMPGATRSPLPGRRDRGRDAPDRAGADGRGGHPLPPRAADPGLNRRAHRPRQPAQAVHRPRGRLAAPRGR